MEEITAHLGPVSAIIGAQWGDEGKGKLTDILAGHYDILARASGGANAGHTIVVNDTKHIFHLLPSGCMHEGKEIVLGSGMVIHLPTLLKEIALLSDAGNSVVPRLHISHAAHIVLDIHKRIDGALEERRKGEKIGTTLRGIGPTYADKAYRTGLRMGDLAKMSTEELKRFLSAKAHEALTMFDVRMNTKEELHHLLAAHKLLKSRVQDTVSFLHNALGKQTVLIEGAQATFLDLDHGTYPHVTSSSTTTAGALQALGLPPQSISSVVGVVKAYCTRVGSGSFPTEITGTQADALRTRGAEFGATTGRPRRVGWLDLSDLRRAAAINGFTHLNLTKLDVLDQEDVIPVYDGSKKSELRGWRTSTKGFTEYLELPEPAQEYIEHIEQHTKLPVTFIGTGPGREEMIVRTPVLEA